VCLSAGFQQTCHNIMKGRNMLLPTIAAGPN
jgi:hypothetical protein